MGYTDTRSVGSTTVTGTPPPDGIGGKRRPLSVRVPGCRRTGSGTLGPTLKIEV